MSVGGYLRYHDYDYFILFFVFQCHLFFCYMVSKEYSQTRTAAILKIV